MQAYELRSLVVILDGADEANYSKVFEMDLAKGMAKVRGWMIKHGHAEAVASGSA